MTKRTVSKKYKRGGADESDPTKKEDESVNEDLKKIREEAKKKFDEAKLTKATGLDDLKNQIEDKKKAVDDSDKKMREETKMKLDDLKKKMEDKNKIPDSDKKIREEGKMKLEDLLNKNKQNKQISTNDVIKNAMLKNRTDKEYIQIPQKKISGKDIDPQKLLSSLGNNTSSSTSKGTPKKTPYETLRDTIVAIIKAFKEFINKNANTYSIADFIEMNPTKTTMINGKSVVQNIAPLKKSSFTYIILYTIILFVFSIIPAVILGLTLYYFISLMNISKWFRKKMFYGDNVSYRNLDQLYNVFRRFYINDYTLYMVIICLVYLVAIIYISFSSYVKFTNDTFRTYSFSVYSFIGLCIAIIAVHLSIYYNFIQEVGRLRDKINNTVYNHINLDYVDYLTNLDKNNSKCKEECEMKLPTGDTINICSCEPSIIEINSIDNLHSYVMSLLDELESKASPTDVKIVSVETFKTYKNDKGVAYYDLILDAIMTFSLLLNFSNTKYDININKSFLENRTPLIATINDSTNILYDFAPMKCGVNGNSRNKCLNRDMDGQENTSKYMTRICEEVQNLVQDVREDIGKLKNKMGHLTVSIQFFTILLTLIVCIIYYMSFLY